MQAITGSVTSMSFLLAVHRITKRQNSFKCQTWRIARLVAKKKGDFPSRKTEPSASAIEMVDSLKRSLNSSLTESSSSSLSISVPATLLTHGD